MRRDNRPNTVVNAAPRTATKSATDWHHCWSSFAEGMRQITESIEAMKQIYLNTFMWDRPIQR